MFEALQSALPYASTLTAVRSAFGECTGTIQTWRLAMARKRNNRRAIEQMLALDDRLLDDIGVTRADLMALVQRPPIRRFQERRS